MEMRFADYYTMRMNDQQHTRLDQSKTRQVSPATDDHRRIRKNEIRTRTTIASGGRERRQDRTSDRYGVVSSHSTTSTSSHTEIRDNTTVESFLAADKSGSKSTNASSSNRTYSRRRYSTRKRQRPTSMKSQVIQENEEDCIYDQPLMDATTIQSTEGDASTIQTAEDASTIISQDASETITSRGEDSCTLNSYTSDFFPREMRGRLDQYEVIDERSDHHPWGSDDDRKFVCGGNSFPCPGAAQTDTPRTLPPSLSALTRFENPSFQRALVPSHSNSRTRSQKYYEVGEKRQDQGDADWDMDVVSIGRQGGVEPEDLIHGKSRNIFIGMLVEFIDESTNQILAEENTTLPALHAATCGDVQNLVQSTAATILQEYLSINVSAGRKLRNKRLQRALGSRKIRSSGEVTSASISTTSSFSSALQHEDVSPTQSEHTRDSSATAFNNLNSRLRKARLSRARRPRSKSQQRDLIDEKNRIIFRANVIILMKKLDLTCFEIFVLSLVQYLFRYFPLYQPKRIAYEYPLVPYTGLKHENFKRLQHFFEVAQLIHSLINEKNERFRDASSDKIFGDSSSSNIFAEASSCESFVDVSSNERLAESSSCEGLADASSYFESLARTDSSFKKNRSASIKEAKTAVKNATADSQNLFSDIESVGSAQRNSQDVDDTLDPEVIKDVLGLSYIYMHLNENDNSTSGDAAKTADEEDIHFKLSSKSELLIAEEESSFREPTHSIPPQSEKVTDAVHFFARLIEGKLDKNQLTKDVSAPSKRESTRQPPRYAEISHPPFNNISSVSFQSINDDGYHVSDPDIKALIDKAKRDTDISRLSYVDAHIQNDDDSDDGLAEELIETNHTRDLELLVLNDQDDIFSEPIFQEYLWTLVFETDLSALDYVNAHYFSKLPDPEFDDDGLSTELRNLHSIETCLGEELSQINFQPVVESTEKAATSQEIVTKNQQVIDTIQKTATRNHKTAIMNQRTKKPKTRPPTPEILRTPKLISRQQHPVYAQKSQCEKTDENEFENVSISASQSFDAKIGESLGVAASLRARLIKNREMNNLLRESYHRRHDENKSEIAQKSVDGQQGKSDEHEFEDTRVSASRSVGTKIGESLGAAALLRARLMEIREKNKARKGSFRKDTASEETASIDNSAKVVQEPQKNTDYRETEPESLTSVETKESLHSEQLEARTPKQEPRKQQTPPRQERSKPQLSFEHDSPSIIPASSICSVNEDSIIEQELSISLESQEIGQSQSIGKVLPENSDSLSDEEKVKAIFDTLVAISSSDDESEDAVESDFTESSDVIGFEMEEARKAVQAALLQFPTPLHVPGAAPYQQQKPNFEDLAELWGKGGYELPGADSIEDGLDRGNLIVSFCTQPSTSTLGFCSESPRFRDHENDGYPSLVDTTMSSQILSGLSSHEIIFYPQHEKTQSQFDATQESSSTGGKANPGEFGCWICIEKTAVELSHQPLVADEGEVERLFLDNTTPCCGPAEMRATKLLPETKCSHSQTQNRNSIEMSDSPEHGVQAAAETRVGALVKISKSNNGENRPFPKNADENKENPVGENIPEEQSLGPPLSVLEVEHIVSMEDGKANQLECCFDSGIGCRGFLKNEESLDSLKFFYKSGADPSYTSWVSYHNRNMSSEEYESSQDIQDKSISATSSAEAAEKVVITASFQKDQVYVVRSDSIDDIALNKAWSMSPIINSFSTASASALDDVPDDDWSLVPNVTPLLEEDTSCCNLDIAQGDLEVPNFAVLQADTERKEALVTGGAKRRLIASMKLEELSLFCDCDFVSPSLLRRSGGIPSCNEGRVVRSLPGTQSVNPNLLIERDQRQKVVTAIYNNFLIENEPHVQPNMSEPLSLPGTDIKSDYSSYATSEESDMITNTRKSPGLESKEQCSDSLSTSAETSLSISVETNKSKLVEIKPSSSNRHTQDKYVSTNDVLGGHASVSLHSSSRRNGKDEETIYKKPDSGQVEAVSSKTQVGDKYVSQSDADHITEHVFEGGPQSSSSQSAGTDVKITHKTTDCETSKDFAPNSEAQIETEISTDGESTEMQVENQSKRIEETNSLISIEGESIEMQFNDLVLNSSSSNTKRTMGYKSLECDSQDEMGDSDYDEDAPISSRKRTVPLYHFKKQRGSLSDTDNHIGGAPKTQAPGVVSTEIKLAARELLRDTNVSSQPTPRMRNGRGFVRDTWGKETSNEGILDGRDIFNTIYSADASSHQERYLSRDVKVTDEMFNWLSDISESEIGGTESSSTASTSLNSSWSRSNDGVSTCSTEYSPKPPVITVDPTRKHNSSVTIYIADDDEYKPRAQKRAWKSWFGQFADMNDTFWSFTCREAEEDDIFKYQVKEY